MRTIRVFLLAFVALAPTRAAETTISDTIRTPFYRLLFNGTVDISGPDMTSPDGETVARWQNSVSVVNGVFSIRLLPNDTATPAGTYYTVRYTPSPIQRGPAWTETWTIATGGPYKINQVRVLTIPSVGLSILPSQIAAGGATTGQCLAWSGSVWAGAACGSGGGGGITSLGSQTGSTQTFGTPGTTGTAPNWVSGSNIHTLHLPLASAVGVTGGLISKTEYDAFNGKQAAISGAPGTWPSTFAPTAHNLLSTSHGDTSASSAVLGGILFANLTPAWAQLAGNTDATRKFLRQLGTGTASAAPAWDTLQAADVPTLNQSTSGNAATASALAANQGTTTTVLHGNAAGTPAFAAVTASDFGTQTANQGLFGPASGSAATPGFRALVQADMPTAVRVRSVGYAFDGGGAALVAGKSSAAITVPFACTIAGWNLNVDTGTATVKVWKIASGTAIPTVSNSINTSGVAISSGTALHSTTLTDFTTTAVTANDIVIFNISALATATQLYFGLECNQ